MAVGWTKGVKFCSLSDGNDSDWSFVVSTDAI